MISAIIVLNNSKLLKIQILTLLLYGMRVNKMPIELMRKVIIIVIKMIIMMDKTVKAVYYWEG